MSDGVRLSAQLWLPDRADHEPVPAILEFIPYRKRDGVALRDMRITPGSLPAVMRVSGLTCVAMATPKA